MNVLTKALTAAAALALSATAAHAVVIFNVSGVFSGGGTLTGTFTTNDALTQVVGLDLTSSQNGAFQLTNYTNTGSIDNQQLPNTFRLTVTQPTKQLQLFFSPALSATGGTITGNSFEAQQIQGAGNRTLTGSVSSASVTAAVPEPATWAMMLLGFGFVGSAMRRRQRQTVRVNFA